MSKVIVSVVGIQKDVYSEENRIELTTIGRHYKKQGIHYISYSEDGVDGQEATKTLLKVEPDCITLIRRGEIRQEQKFCLQQANSSRYHTPYGEMMLTVLTQKLNASFGPVSGAIDITYELSINGQWQSFNHLYIKVCADNNGCEKVN